MDLKDALAALLQEGRRREESDLVPHVDDRPAPEAGAWTGRDVLAHLMSWRNVAAGELAAAADGVPAPPVDHDDAENARIYAETHDLPAARVIASAAESWAALETAMRRVPEKRLRRRREKVADEQLWEVIPNNSYIHLSEHLAWWHLARGDPARAEAIALWGHELAQRMATTDVQRGTARYNLGCFHARSGDARRAVPLIREGIRLRPDLREWARRDPDLDPIREDADVKALLA